MNSSPEIGEHLTDEEFAALLAGESLASGAETHLLACDPCRVEVNAVQASLGEFNSFSMGWAEVQARRTVPVPSRWALRLVGHPAWRVGILSAATLLAVGLGMGLGMGPGMGIPHHASPVNLPASALQADPTRAELAVDNHLMTSIDAALNDAAEPTVPVAELRATPAHADSHPDGMVEN